MMLSAQWKPINEDTSVITTKEKIAIMQHYEDGGDVEVLVNSTFTEWATMTRAGEPTWDWRSRQYRIKREPLEVYVNIYSDDGSAVAHKTAAKAKVNVTAGAVRIGVKFREVIDE